MKNFCLLIFLFTNTLLFSQNKQEVQLLYTRISLEEFIEELESKYALSFLYGNVDLNKKITCNYTGELFEGLSIIFESINIKHKKTAKHIILKPNNNKEVSGNIFGTILDSDNKIPIVGATIIFQNSNPLIGTSSSLDGQFALANLAIGRYDLKVSYLGYESKILNQVQISSAKDLVLTIALNPAISDINEVLIKPKLDKRKAINEMAMTSSSVFSVEETQRYAATASDPARMIQNYSNVTFSDFDSSNDIVIRANSPRALKWEIDGLEIPTINHFGLLGGSGGSISILNSSSLSNSDFYSGNFPTQFGNALSGIFDVKLRNGNYEKAEHHFKISLLGLDIGTEGKFNKKSKATYNINYRFSSSSLYNLIVDELENNVSIFQDFSFKFHLPTKKLGNFSLFGLGGFSHNAFNNSEKAQQGLPLKSYREQNITGLVGLTHKKILSPKIQLKSTLGISSYIEKKIFDSRDSLSLLTKTREKDIDINNINVSLNSNLNIKINNKNQIKLGVLINNKVFNNYFYLNDNNQNKIYLNSATNTLFLQNYMQWKFRLSQKLTTNIGYHFSYLSLNNTFAIDPRFGIEYQISQKHSIAFSSGIYSKPEHITTYLIAENSLGTKPNLDLQMTNSFQTVLANNFKFAKDFNFKTEIYYQYIYNVPVVNSSTSNFSTLNAENFYDIITNDQLELVNKGTGQNYGIDLVLEKYFSKKYYGSVLISIFDSYYTDASQRKFRTDYANLFLIKIFGGKEFLVGKYQNNIIALNGRLTLNGGNRFTEIDLANSIVKQEKVVFQNAVNERQFDPYFRFDFGFSYKINSKKATHTLLLDIQNLVNINNYTTIDFDVESNSIVKNKQFGLLPFASYKVDF